MPRSDNIYGYGLIRPFRRDQASDFAATGGVELVKSSVGQILGTFGGNDDQSIPGEIPWDTERGSKLALLRHRKLDFTTQELARAWVIQALGRWEPRVQVTGVRLERAESAPGSGENVLRIILRYDILAQPGAANQVLVRDVVQTVAVSEVGGGGGGGGGGGMGD